MSTGNLRPTTRTKFSVQDYARAVRAAAPELSKAAAGVLWAQYALETGRGSACWNCNIGNVKATPAQVAAGTPYFMLPNTWEIIAGKKIVFQPPDPQTWFRHFDTLAEAMAHHVVFLRERRYAPAWPAVLAGDPERFAHELKRLGYYTGSADIYARSLRVLHSEWMGAIDYDESDPGTTLADVSGDVSGDVEPAPDTPISPIHGTHVVDWAIAQRAEQEGDGEA